MPRAILITDDAPGTARLIQMMLEMDYPDVAVDLTETVADAARHLAVSRYDLWLLDRELPDGVFPDSFDRVAPACKTVLYTGWDDPGFLAAAAQRGVPVIIKGKHTAPELLAEIMSHLHERHQCQSF